MVEITDDYMVESITSAKEYCVVILKAGPKFGMEGADKLIHEHARRNFALREDGLLSIVCPITDGSYLHGISIFDAKPKEVKKLMDEDPGVQEGLFAYEIHPCKSFPGDSLPK